MCYDEENFNICFLQPKEILNIEIVGSRKCDHSKFHVY